MKYFILTTLLLITTLSYNLTAQQISSEDYNKNYIHEDFNEVSEHFKTVTTTDNYFILDKGDYLLSRNNNESEYAIIADNSTVSDFVLKTVIRIGPSNNKKASLGIILKAQQDGKGAVIFEINNQGKYRIKQLVGSTYKTLSGNTKQGGWVKSKLVSGVDEHNFIEIRSEKNIYDVYANSEYLTTFLVPDLASGSCGLLISPETKARVSYFYINLKGENNVVTDYTNKNTKTSNNNIKELNNEKGLIHAKEIDKLTSKNTDLATISVEQEKEISSLKNKNSELQIENKNITKLHQINIKHKNDLNSKEQEIKNLKTENKNIAKLHQINSKHENNLENKDQQIQELNQRVNLKKNKISELNKKNIDLASITLEQEKQIKTIQASVKDLRFAENEASTNNKDLNKKVSGLQQQISVEKSATTELTGKLTKSNNELTSLKSTQAKHDNLTTNLNAQIADLSNRMQLLTTYVNTANDKNKSLQTTNDELKELFILKDFEINGIKPSEMVKEIPNIPPAPKVLIGNKTIYSVQFGVYMQQQEYHSTKNIDDVWYNTTEQGTYIYYSGEFNLPQEAATHMKNLISKGYTNAFVVTLTK